MTETPSHLPLPLPQRKRPGWYRGNIRISQSALFENFINLFIVLWCLCVYFLGYSSASQYNSFGVLFFSFYQLDLRDWTQVCQVWWQTPLLYTLSFVLVLKVFILYLKLFIFYVWASCLHYICASCVCLVAVEARRWCVSRIRLRSADPETRAIACLLYTPVELFQDGLKFQILQWNTW